jgi:predicted amidohydrolase
VQDLNLALLQADLHWQEPEKNRQLFTGLIAEHAATADLIVLPETFTTGFTMDAGANAEPLSGPTVKWLVEIANRHETALCGSLIIEAEGRYYNRLVFAQPGEQLRTYDKRHLFRMGGEREAFTPGAERLIITLGEWRICPLVCYDLRFPVWSRGSNEYDLLLYVANWPASRRSAWETLLPARAIENLCYAAGVNRVGTDGRNVEYAGGSMISDYLGNKLALGGAAAQVLTARLSLDALHRYREKFPAWKDADPFMLLDTGN